MRAVVFERRVTMLRGFCVDGSIVRRRKDHADLPGYQVATAVSGCTDRAREAIADRLPLQRRRVQGFAGLAPC